MALACAATRSPLVFDAVNKRPVDLARGAPLAVNRLQFRGQLCMSIKLLL
jgi:hypothetical protein